MKGGICTVNDIPKKRAAPTFLSGILVLTAANLLTKIIGLVFKIPLTNMLGDEGMGYFNTAYQIYTWLYMISTAGLPVALSLMISEYNAKNEREKSRRIFKLSLTVFTVVGLIGSLLMFLLCRPLASFIAADMSYLCILAIAPALFFVCISSTIRGYFQGHRNMVPTAVSEVIESAGKLTIGIALGTYALNKGYPLHTVAAYAIFGVTVGIAAGAIFLAIFALFSRRGQEQAVTLPSADKTESSGKLFGTFLKIALPVMLSSSLLSMSSMLDTLIVIRRLGETGLAEEAAVSLYGNYTAYCVTLFNLPPVLIYPIVNTLIPSLSGARAAGNRDRVKLLLYKSLKLASVIALPCSLGLAVMSGPVLKLIFSNAQSAEMAAPLLTALAPSVFLIGIMAVTNGVLQSCRLQRLSVISMAAGAAVKAVSAYLLVGVKIGDGYLHMYASPISTFLFYLTITVLNFYFIAKHVGVKVPILSIFFRPFAASVVCAVSAAGVYMAGVKFIGEGRPLTLLAIAAAGVIYCICLIILGGITKEDIRLIPKAEALLRRLPRISALIRGK